MSENNKNPNLLIGLSAITTHANISKPTFYKLVKNHKFPAVVIDGTWYAHKENIDNYFKAVTKIPMQTIPEDAQ